VPAHPEFSTADVHAGGVRTDKRNARRLRTPIRFKEATVSVVPAVEPGSGHVLLAPARPIVVTGFAPFGGETENPSRLIARALDGTRIDTILVVGVELPVRTHAVRAALEEVWALAPRILLHLGQAGGRAQISLERVAVNLLDFSLPDEDGERIEDAPVVPGGPAAYFSTLPVRRVLHRLRAAGIPAHLSLSAGAFLCNQVFYLTQDHLAAQDTRTLSGFVHVPFLPGQAAAKGPQTPSLSLETMLAAVRLTLEVAVEEWRSADPALDAQRAPSVLAPPTCS